MLANPVDALHAGIAALREVDWDAVPVPERLRLLQAMETASRSLRAVTGSAMAALAADPVETLGDRPTKIIADTLRISTAEAGRRVREAGLLAERTAVSGAPLPPLLTETAKHWHAGTLDPEHVKVIAAMLADLPADTPFDVKEDAEAFLAGQATQMRPDQLDKVAQRLAATINPDGNYTDIDRKRKRGITIGGQHSDLMSPISGWITPELRATLDAVLNKLAAPGMCHPDHQSPRVDGEPDPQLAGRDARSTAQRNHDAALAMCRAILASGELGSHHGLPVTVLVTTTLDQLENATGCAVTASGSLLPMSDVIRMAAHAYHYLAIYERHSAIPLYLGRTRRLASVGQRIMLHSIDRGCTFPNCTVPGYRCEVDHITGWGPGGPTDIDDLTFECPHHHRRKTHHGWTVRKRKDGRTEWIPPPHLNHLPGGTNQYHHPEHFLPKDQQDRQ